MKFLLTDLGCFVHVVEPFDGTRVACFRGDCPSPPALLSSPQRPEVSSLQHHLPVHHKAAPGPRRPALRQILHQLWLLQIWTGGVAFKVSKVPFAAFTYLNMSDFFHCTCSVDQFDHSGERDRSEDGLLRFASLRRFDSRVVSPPQEGHRRGLAQILLLYSRAHGVPVSALHRHPSCSLRRYANVFSLI